VAALEIALMEPSPADREVALRQIVWSLERTRSPRLPECLSELSGLRLRAGAVDDALEMAAAAAAAAVPLDGEGLFAWAALARARARSACGDLEGAEALLRACRDASVAELGLRLAWRGAVASLRRRRGDIPAALASHRQAAQDSETAGWIGPAAFHRGMCSILTGRGEDLARALATLFEVGERRAATRLLVEGSRLASDTEVLHQARREALVLGDRFLLLEVLHMLGTPSTRGEARALLTDLRGGCAGRLRPHFEALPAVRWADWTAAGI
jgi:hypothetical protein